MRTRELVAIFALAAITTACTENPDPRKPTLVKMQQEGVGGWIVATSRAGWQVQGELISVTREYVHILRVKQPGAALVYLRTADVARAQVYTYESESGLGAMGVLGTLSTISHGFVLILSAPVWILATAAAISVEMGHVELDYPKSHTLKQLSQWARFPQGIPAAIDEEALLVPRVRRRPALPAPPSPPPDASAPPSPSPDVKPSDVPVTPPTLTPPSETPSVPPATNPSQMFQQAKAAAARNDCATVLQLSGAVQLADQPFWDIVFSKDAQIRKCLGLAP
ncbi:MAG: hypothetical protein ACKV2T_00100 [Kofleriaceae bacterium]